VRCYFVKGGKIIGVQDLSGLSHEEAIETARRRFEEGASSYDGVEVWDRRRIYRQGRISKSGLLMKSGRITNPEPQRNNRKIEGRSR
jgi:hypothetical protein